MAGSHRGRTRSLPFPCGECPVTVVRNLLVHGWTSGPQNLRGPWTLVRVSKARVYIDAGLRCTVDEWRRVATRSAARDHRHREKRIERTVRVDLIENATTNSPSHD